jgi:carboxyl-terminal processing protease
MLSRVFSVRSALGWAVAAALLPAAWLACATPPLPPGEPPGPIAEQTYLRVEKLYLWPEAVDGRVITGAVEALERRFDPVRFEPDGLEGHLFVGKDQVVVPIQPKPKPDEFLATLGGVLQFVEPRIGPDMEEELREDEDLQLLALRGALSALDRYSTIFSGKGTEDFRIRFSGRLEGIGSRIGRREGDLVAVRVFPGSPAEKGGLKDGDAIIAIDGEPTRPMSVSEAVTKIRGPADSRLVLTVQRGEETLEVKITRGKVQVPTVETETLSEGIGYARIFQMSRSTPSEFREKVSELGDLEGLVLDVRSNSGGSMLSSARIADFFLPKGTIVKTVGRQGSPVAGLRNKALATPKVLFPYPIVVLVDSQTASAAEILTGAMASLPQVTVIGQKTFGKGVVQRIYPLPENNLLKLTVAEYRLADDQVIHLEGIEPDAELFAVSTKRLAPLANVPTHALPYLWEPGEDDRFPVEVGEAVLRNGLDTGLAEMRRQTEAKIGAQLAESGVEWEEDPPALPAILPKPLEIELVSPTLQAGQSAKLQLTVKNPNRFPIPDAWATLAAPLEELSKRGLPLGVIPAGGSASVEVEVEPPGGIAAGEVPLLVHVASRLRPMASRLVVLREEEHVPDLEIRVVRREEDVKLTLRNRGRVGTGELRVAVNGVFEALDEIAPEAEETVELALAGKVRKVVVTLLGPLADRRVEIPLPESEITVTPPRVRFQRGGFPGFSRLRVQASDPSGLRDGWISLDDEKKGYLDWDGKPSGSMSISLPHGEHTVRTKVETVEGLAVYDRRIFTKD